MLVLSRRVTDVIRFPELDITIEILQLSNSKVRVGVDAPIEIKVLRGELSEDDIPSLTRKVLISAEDEHHQRNKLNQLTLAAGLARKLLEKGKYQMAASTLHNVLSELSDRKHTSQLTEARELQLESATEISKSALLVEDVANEREMLAGFLRLHGFDVTAVGDGVDAIGFLENNEKPDFILMDMNLPRLHGIETIERIRENPAFDAVEIFAVSGVTPNSLGFDITKNRVAGWFQKPVQPVPLIDAIHSQLHTVSCVTQTTTLN